MIPNNDLSVLPFYSTRDHQNHKKSFAYGSIYPLYSPTGVIPPFQILQNDSEGSTYMEIGLYDSNDNFIALIDKQMIETGLDTIRFALENYTVVAYPGNLSILDIDQKPFLEGQYYLRIVGVGNDYISDIFTWVDSVDCMLQIKWWDIKDLYNVSGELVYAADFKNTIYLDTQLGKPDYKFEEEGETRDGLFFPEKQLSKKIYKFNFIAPEYLCDALRVVRMSDVVQIKYKDTILNCDTIQFNPKWQTQGDLAAVEAEFETATVIKKIGFGLIRDNILGDFNKDFDNDFKL